ncbi:MAG: S8 family serine peptidase [Gammaproteobacteria bacterium]
MKLNAMILGLSLVTATAGAAPSARADAKAERYFVQLDAPSVGEMRADQQARRGSAPTRAAQIAHRNRIAAEQDAMSARVAPYVEHELGRLQVAVNGLKVSATPENAERLRQIKGVRSVARIAHHDIDNAASVEWVQAPQLWQSFGDGTGLTIAIIDSGIDYLHANFGGAGDPLEYEANDKNIVESGSFPTAKVIGGWDFAGPTYNSRVDDFPKPDADPLDGNGHGSHVGGTAAGVGVPERIGPGVAKGASILALKVFSDEGGSTDLTADALEYALDPNGDGAMDDRVDVINMSLGARYGDQNDPSALASTVAVNNGVIVVASAGNNGDEPYVTGSPGVSPQVITVGATISGGRPQIALRVVADDPGLSGLYPAQQGSGVVRIVDAPVRAPLILARSRAVDDDDIVIDGEFDQRACRSLTNAADVAGNVVLAERGGCSYEAKYASVQRAGGAGVVVYNSSSSDLPFVMGGIGISGKEITIPGLMISGTDGARLVQSMSTQSLIVDLAPANTVPGPTDTDDQLTSFTSRGPAHGGAQFKPDLSAPGRYTMSTDAGTGFKARQLRGTSMAAPHVAGAAVLMRQRHPDVPVSGIKAMLQNATVDSELNGPGTGSLAPLTRQGVGVLRVADAAALTSYAAPAGLSFGYSDLSADLAAQRSAQIVNLSGAPRVYSAVNRPRGTLPGVEVRCPATVAVGAGASASFTIDLTVQADQLPADNGSLSHAEIDGWCVFSDGIDTLRVGYLASFDALSNLSVSADAMTVTASNNGVGDGRAEGFALLGTGGTRTASRPIGAVGARQATIFGLPVFELAVALDAAWEAPAHVSIEMYIDAERDGQYERVLFAGDWSLLRFDPGTYVTGVYKVIDNDRPDFNSGYTDWFSEKIDFNDQVMMLPFSLLPEVGLSFLKPNQRQFDYKLRVRSRDGSFDEQSGFVDLDQITVTDEAQINVAAGESRPMTLDHDQPSLWLMPMNRVGEQYQLTPAVRKTGKIAPRRR